MNQIITQYQVSKLLTLTGAFQTVHAVNNGRWFTVRNIHISNSSGAPVTVQVCFVPHGGSAVQGNGALWSFSVPANDFIELADGQKLPPGASVQALASAGAAVNIWVSGIEEALPSA